MDVTSRTVNMFATHTGTPYTGYQLGDTPNDSAGQGDSALRGPGAPPPSGGFTPSVYNRSLDTVTNDVPSVYMIPSKHPSLCADFCTGDLVFVAVGRDAPEGADDYKVRERSRSGVSSTAMMTIRTANAELRRHAREARGAANGANGANVDDHWTCHPKRVAAWLRPVGAVLSVDKVGGGARGVNVCVSRRAAVQHTFMGPMNSPQVHAQSMDSVGVVYHVVDCQLTGQDTVPVVQMWTGLLSDGDDPVTHMHHDQRAIRLDALHDPDVHCHVGNKDNTGRSDQSVVVYIGRVLHSPPRCPTHAECRAACVAKESHHRQSTIEIQLGCP